jgi:hypothetical protein
MTGLAKPYEEIQRQSGVSAAKVRELVAEFRKTAVSKGKRWPDGQLHAALAPEPATRCPRSIRAAPTGCTSHKAMGANFFTHWYLHIPNVILAVLVYLLIARGVLSLVFDRAGPIVRPLRIVTDPVLAVVGFITPRIVPAGLVVVFAIVWLSTARIALLFAATLLGAPFISV